MVIDMKKVSSSFSFDKPCSKKGNLPEFIYSSKPNLFTCYPEKRKTMSDCLRDEVPFKILSRLRVKSDWLPDKILFEILSRLPDKVLFEILSRLPVKSDCLPDEVLFEIVSRIPNEVFFEILILSGLPDKVLVEIFSRLPEKSVCLPADVISEILSRLPVKSVCLPDEVLFEILSWLPVKSIIRFKCVSKTWCFLISSPDFITTHLNRSRSHPRRPPCLVLARFEINYLEIGRLTLNDHFYRRHIFTEWPSMHKKINQSNFLVGSSNGLLCLARDFTNPYCDSYLVWNPSIQKAIALPNPEVRVRDLYVCCLGFGYVPKADDYKLVRLLRYRHEPDNRNPDGTITCWVQTYALQTRTWHTFTGPGPHRSFQSRSSLAFLNGAIHWPTTIIQQPRVAWCNVIISFDMEDETFREVGMPKSLERATNGDIVVVDGMLALILRNSSVEESISVWVMKEYGVVESWTKLFDINNMKFSDRVIGFGETGEVLLNKGVESFSYEPSSQRTVPLPFHGPANFFLEKYVQSLVLLNVEDGVLRQPKWFVHPGAFIFFLSCLFILYLFCSVFK